MKREELREAALAAKAERGLSWSALAETMGRSPVYTAMLVYGYGQATESEADVLTTTLGLEEGAKRTLTSVPNRVPAQTWPPTDPFIYRFYEAVMLYGPVWKDVAHEL